MAHVVWRGPLFLVVVACSSSAAPTRQLPPPNPTPAVVVAPPRPDPFAAQNLGFEVVAGAKPTGWEIKGGEGTTVTDAPHGGARSLALEGERFAATTLDAKPYVGKRIVVRGFIKSLDTVGAALWVRADDAANEMVAFDNMRARIVVGTQAWTATSVKIDVPSTASRIVLGCMQVGRGASWFDDLSIEVGEILPPEKIILGGAVVDAAGAPVVGAEVALISPEGAIQLHVKSGERGRFELPTLEGRWGVSAHRAGGVGAFLALKEYPHSADDLKIALGKDGGVVVRGKTSSKPKPGTYLRISPFSEFDADLFAVPVADDGSFEAVLPPSTEYYVAELDGFANGNFKRVGDHVDVKLVTPSLEPAPAAVVAYIAKQGIPLASAEAGKGFDDMAPIGKLVGKARIVALGEATHGSREIFLMKHRWVEYLVAKQGFTVFAIEANQPECRVINDYVLNGKGNARDALAGIYFWTWNTEEVLAMIEWMRAWNADASHKQKIQFTGFDMQTSDKAFASVEAFVLKAEPEKGKQLVAPIAVLGEQRASDVIAKASADERKAIKDGLAALAPILAKADADTRHDLRVLEQAAGMYMEKSPFDARDAGMAENVGWLLDHTKARIVLWAHNGHISNTLSTYTNMGSHLRKKYKRDYLNVGFVFGEGSFQALDFTRDSHQLAEHTLATPPVYYASSAFAATGKPMLVLDLRPLPKQGPVADWFAAPHPVRDTGAVFAGEKQMTYPMVLPTLFDAVIYIDKTTRARPLKK